MGEATLGSKDRPIIFSAPMVRALLDGRKSQTRRVLKKTAALDALAVFGPQFLTLPGNIDLIGYAPGDRLYVREAWRAERGQDRQNATEIAAACLDAGYSRVWCPIFYEVDAERVNFENGMVAGRYRHARFMPRWASRITLAVTEVRVQRLQEISEADAVAEGCAWSDLWEGFTPCPDAGDARYFNSRSAARSFEQLWLGIHGPDAWDANPWVVAVSFTVRKGNIDQVAAS
jgi:hypothetical protein